MPFEIPSSWEWTRLSDVCQIVGRIGFRGYTKSDLVESNGAITLSPSNIVDGKMEYSKCTYISWGKYEESPEIQIQNGDILLVKTGSSYGKCALVENLPQKATINPQFVTLKHIAIKAAFLTYILQSDYARTNYDNFVLGTAIPTFTQVALGNMFIPLAPQNEQIRILQEIERLFALIDEIEANKQDLQEYIKQVKSKVLDLAIHGKLVPHDPNDEPAIELLHRINPSFKPCDTSHYENLPETWCVAHMSEVYNHTTGKALKKADMTGELRQYITTSNVYWNSFDFTEVRSMYFTEKELDKCTAHKGDLLVCNGGDVGRAAIWDYDYDICYQNHISRLRPISVDIVFNPFYSYLFRYLKDKGQLNGKGVAITSLSAADIQSLAIPVPPLSEQKRIVERIETIFAQLDTITAEL